VRYGYGSKRFESPIYAARVSTPRRLPRAGQPAGPDNFTQITADIDSGRRGPGSSAAEGPRAAIPISKR